MPSCMQRKTPRCPAGEDARPREVPIPRHGLGRAVVSVSRTGAQEPPRLRSWPPALRSTRFLYVVVLGSKPLCTSRDTRLSAQGERAVPYARNGSSFPRCPGPRSVTPVTPLHSSG